MPTKKSGGTGYEGIDERKNPGFDQQKKNDQGQGGFDKGMDKGKDLGREGGDLGTEKHGIGQSDTERGGQGNVGGSDVPPRE
jgi:hypothetical protein